MVRKSDVALIVGGTACITFASSSLYLLSVVNSGFSHDVFVLLIILLNWAWIPFLYYDPSM